MRLQVHLVFQKKLFTSILKIKQNLVAAVTDFMFLNICDGIDMICALKKNPIEEIFDIKRFVMSNLKDEKSSPQYQLQKYYPKIFATVKKKQFDIMQDCVKENLSQGKAQNLYRKEIDIEFISRIYFSGIMSIKDKDLFPLTDYSMKTLMDYYLEYHLRGICTEKGMTTIREPIKTEINKP